MASKPRLGTVKSGLLRPGMKVIIDRERYDVVELKREIRPIGCQWQHFETTNARTICFNEIESKVIL